MDLYSGEVFWWLSGEVQGLSCKRCGFESRSGPSFFSFLFFGLDIIKVMYFFFLFLHSSKVLTFNKKKK